MKLPYRSLRIRASLLLGMCWALACGSEPPAKPQPPAIPAGPGLRTVVPPSGAGSVAATGGVLSTAPGQVGVGMPAGRAPALLDIDAGLSNAGAGAAGTLATAGRGGASAAGSSGRAGGGGAAGRAGASAAGGGGAAGAEPLCQDVFCFTPIECLFLAIPCGFTECTNFACR